MYISIGKDFWDKNSEHFLKRYETEYENDEEPGYLIDTDEDKLFTEYDDLDWAASKDGWPILSRSNQGLYVSFLAKLTKEQFKEIIEEKPEFIPIAIEVITKKFNQIKSLIESAKAL